MKRGKPLPIPQREFGFTSDVFNLFQECTADGERIVSEHEQTEKARKTADKAQRRLFRMRKQNP
jgi:hypothetical protein